MMVDTHCHIQFPEFDADREAVLERAGAADVQVLISAGIDVESSRRAVEFAEKHDGVYALVAVHPNELEYAAEDWPQRIRELARHPKVKGIGETGMDLYRQRTEPDVQRRALAVHLEIARDAGLPVAMHSRAAGREVLDVVEGFAGGKPVRGIMHCFTDKESVMTRAVAAGLHVSFAGPLTYPISRKNRELMKNVPDSRILIETDAPYLGAQPVKHRRNEPSYLRYIAAKVAEMRRISPRDASRITTLNADDIFGLGVADRRPKVAYGIRSMLYLNITNRCNGRCSFCPRTAAVDGGEASSAGYYVKGHNLLLDREPTAEEVMDAMGVIEPYREIVFCGLGEPTLRLEVLLGIARWVRAQGQRVRLDTNGLGSLQHGRSIVPELKDAVDAVSVSLNAPSAEEYVRLCQPEAGAAAFQAVVDFIREAHDLIPDVTLTAVELPGLDVRTMKKLARDLGVQYHGRKAGMLG